MSQIRDWSALYDIDEDLMARLHTSDPLEVLYPNPELISLILERNSRLLQEFLTSMPRHSKNGREFGLSIDFMLPTDDSFREIFVGDFHPKLRFEETDDEIATFLFGSDGSWSYFGPPLSGKRPTYVQMCGFGQEGSHRLITEAMPAQIEHWFFVYSMAVGYAYDQRKRETLSGHRDVGVGGYVLWYSCSERWYNPSSSINHERLAPFWDKRSQKMLEASIKKINRRFFKNSFRH